MIYDGKLKLSRTGFFNSLLFICFIIVYEYLIVFYNMGNEISNWRYYIFALVTCVAFLTYLLEKRQMGKDKKIFGKELLYLIIVAIVFFLISVLKCKNLGVQLPFRVLVQISLFLLPALYAYVLINIFDMNKIISLMKITTIVTIIMYFFEPAHTIFKFLEIDNWMAIELFHSISFTESHNFFDTFLQLFLFFNYFKTKVGDKHEKRKLEKYYRLTLLFTILSFKRLGLLFLFVIIFLKKFIHYDNEIKISTFFKASFFVIVTVLFTKILQGELLSISYDKLFDFTSGRNWFLKIWENKKYISYGYGSSLLVIGRFLEMDLTQIYLELNIYCLFIYCYAFFCISKNNLYTNLIMLYVFLNMLTSSSLPWSIGWIVMFTNVACITSNKYSIEKGESL